MTVGDFDGWDFPLLMLGTGHSVSQERADDDPAEDVRRIAEEVTGKKFDPPKRPIGFY